MQNSNISLFLIIISILIVFFAFSCANPQPPSGGPPDTIPPEILEIYPDNQTVNFEKRNVLLRFSKYMERAKVIENLTISPNVPLQFEWSGKLLEIELPNELDTSVTYSISLGTDYSDIYNNKPSQAFSLIFSAGSKIDSGFISGKVYDPKPDGAYIYAYIIDNINPDTLNPSSTKPDYKVQLGSTGEFRIPALKDATYRFFVLRDQFRNELYESVDAFGASINDVKVYKSKSEPTILKIGNLKDISGPILNDASSEYANYIIVKFSEPIDDEYINSESFEVISVDNTKKAEIISASVHYENKSRVDILTAAPLDTSLVWNVIGKSKSKFSIRDSSGNLINDTLNIAKFKSNSYSDTNQIYLVYASIKDSSEYVPIAPAIDIIFNKAIDARKSEINIGFTEIENSKSIPFKSLINGSYLTLKPDIELSSSKWYRIEANLKNIKSYSNNLTYDTSFAFVFKTIDLKVKGSISGVVQYENEICDFKKIIVMKHTNGRYIYTDVLNEKNEWSFKNIETGDYTAELFCDVDGNGEYSFGNLYPYKFAEPFVIFEDVFKLKPRWQLENIILKVKDSYVR